MITYDTSFEYHVNPIISKTYYNAGKYFATYSRSAYGDFDDTANLPENRMHTFMRIPTREEADCNNNQSFLCQLKL